MLMTIIVIQSIVLGAALVALYVMFEDRRIDKVVLDKLAGINIDLNEKNANLKKSNLGLIRTNRNRTSRFDKRIAQLQQELRDEQENSLRLTTTHMQRQDETDRQLTQAHALLEMVLEADEADTLRRDAPLSRHKMREVFCV